MHPNQCMLGQNRYSIQEWKILLLVVMQTFLYTVNFQHFLNSRHMFFFVLLTNQ